MIQIMIVKDIFMNKARIIKRIERFVRQRLSGEGTGHDWWHVDRVRRIALKIAAREGGDQLVIALAALLHDIADWKFHGDEKVGSKLARQVLGELKVEQAIIDQVCDIIGHISFKGAGVNTPMATLEGKIVQDADRLDVLGAIGIARVFAYGGYKQRPIYDPDIKIKLHKTFAQYRSSSSPSINHFHEKLLLIKDRLNTKTARQIARSRHKFLENYLKQFYREWRGKDLA